VEQASRASRRSGEGLELGRSSRTGAAELEQHDVRRKKLMSKDKIGYCVAGD
jgi:hypothetical protein